MDKAVVFVPSSSTNQEVLSRLPRSSTVLLWMDARWRFVICYYRYRFVAWLQAKLYPRSKSSWVPTRLPFPFRRRLSAIVSR